MKITEWICHLDDRFNSYASLFIRRFTKNDSILWLKSLTLICDEREYSWWKRRYVLSSKLSFKNWCFLSYKILDFATTNAMTSSIFFWKTKRFFSNFDLATVVIVFDDCRKANDIITAIIISLNWKSMTTWLRNFSITTCTLLFKLNYKADNAFIQLISKLTTIRNRSAISIVWFVRFDWSFVCEW